MANPAISPHVGCVSHVRVGQGERTCTYLYMYAGIRAIKASLSQARGRTLRATTESRAGMPYALVTASRMSGPRGRDESPEKVDATIPANSCPQVASGGSLHTVL